MAELKNAIKALDPNPSNRNDITLLLGLLHELCENKANVLSTIIEADLWTADRKSIPIMEILARHKEYRAYVKSDTGKLDNEVASAVRGFMAGDDKILGKIANSVTTGLRGILTSNAGERVFSYIILQDNLIARYDIRVWSRPIEAQSVISHIDNALVIVAYKSAVDFRKLLLNDLLIAYGSQLNRMNFSGAEQQTYLAYAEELYAKLRDY